MDYADTPWAAHPGAPVSVLGTNTTADLHTLFTGTGTQLKPPQLEASSRIHLVLTITVLPKFQRLNSATTLLSLSGCVTYEAGAVVAQEY